MDLVGPNDFATLKKHGLVCAMVSNPTYNPSPLSGHDLASRLSYFLWSSMPDQELLNHAAAGDLDRGLEQHDHRDRHQQHGERVLRGRHERREDDGEEEDPAAALAEHLVAQDADGGEAAAERQTGTTSAGATGAVAWRDAAGAAPGRAAGGELPRRRDGRTARQLAQHAVPPGDDRRVDEQGQRRRFTSEILPPYMRRSPKVAEVLPILYLRGLSTGDCREALPVLLGEQATGLSPTTITRLTAAWEDEYRAFCGMSLADRDYVYLWADGVHFRVRLEEDRLCTLVLIGARPDGTKELLAVEDGYRESTESWATLLRGLKRRGMKAPEVAVGDDRFTWPYAAGNHTFGAADTGDGDRTHLHRLIGLHRKDVGSLLARLHSNRRDHNRGRVRR